MPVPSRRLPTLMLLALLAALTGCRGVARVSVPITGPAITADTKPVVDVRNWAGPVSIVTDPSFDHASVRAKVIPRRKGAPKGDDLERQTFLAAESTSQDGRATLRVVSETRLGDPDLSEVRLMIHVPSCGGLTVRSAGGTIKVRGPVSGPIDIENGAGNREGGPVILRTSEVIRDPVSITTTNGKIHFQAPPGSSGEFDIRSEAGEAVMFALAGSLNVTGATADHFTGTLNKGENPATIRTGKGRAEVYIIENAGSYRPRKR